MNVKDYIISENCSVREALEAINSNSRGIVYICEGLVLKATVTDGNIRRHILKNGKMNVSVSCVANYAPLFIMREENVNPIEFMKENHISSVPILNSKREIITIKFLVTNISAHTASNLNVPVVIMAGGKGTRLMPFTQVLPKPLIPIKDKTITEIIMDKFKEFGCNEFEMIVNYKKELIKTFFSEKKNTYNVEFIDEPYFMGTGGGLRLLKGRYDNSFFMTNCDIVVDEDYGEILRRHNEEKRIITIVSAVRNIEIPYGTIEVDNDNCVKKMHEKPVISHLVNTGFYLINKKFLNYIPDNTFIHITEIIESCIEAGEKVGIYPISEKNWWDMGQHDELRRMSLEFE